MKIYSSVDADEIKEGTWGYFSNDVGHIKQALEKYRINAYTFYDRLNKVLPEHEPRRFEATDTKALFSLFCPVGEEYDEKNY